METQNQKAVSTGEWMGTILITALPLIGFIMLFVWAFSDGTNPSKANWAKATLLWMVIFMVLGGLVFLTFGTALMSAFS